MSDKSKAPTTATEETTVPEKKGPSPEDVKQAVQQLQAELTALAPALARVWEEDDARQPEYRRLQLMGVAPEVIAPLLDYVEALNAKRLKMAVEQFPHMLADDGVTEEHRQEHADRYGFRDAEGRVKTSPMLYKADCEGCVSGQGFPTPTLKTYFAVDPAATGAGKYVQVVDMEPHFQTGEIRPSGVHSVVNKVTGEVSKSAGWKKGPAKSTSKARKGQPLVAFTLTDPDQCAAVFARMDIYGGYLYSK